MEDEDDEEETEKEKGKKKEEPYYHINTLPFETLYELY